MDDNKTDGLEPVDASGRDNGGDKTQRIDSCDKNLLLSEFGEFGAKATKRKGRFARFLRNRFVPFWTGHNKRNIKIAAVVLSAAAVFVLSFYGVRIIKLLGTVDYDDGIDFSNKDATYVEDETDFSAMHEVSDAGSLDELLREWAINGGEKMYSKNVINVMLFGVDSEDGTMSGARSDAMMLASVNLKTKKITLVSFFRDSYTYMNIDGSIRYNKINAANNWGGPATVVETLENNYKIEIDKFVSVDFKTFPDIIDSLGGVTVPVTEYEAKFVRRTTRYKNFKAGDAVRLTGDEALMFSRIRHLDSDINRTRRQRSVIMAIIESTKDANNRQLNKALDFIFPNIRTNYTKSEILSLGSKALSQGWMDFEIQQMVSPSENAQKSAYINGAFVWIVDYPAEARAVQLALYGTTNIVLDANRNNVLSLLTPRNTSGNTNNHQPTGSSGSTRTQTTAPGVNTTAAGTTSSPATTEKPVETTLPPDTTQATTQSTTSPPTTAP